MMRFPSLAKTMARTMQTSIQNHGKLTALVLGAVALAGCSNVQRTPPIQVWPDMRIQEKFETQRMITSDTLAGIFPDMRQDRVRPTGVVARGRLEELTPFNTGMENGLFVGRMPVEITAELINEGQARFNVYCAPCHDETGLGKGMVPRRFPAWQPQNLMEQRILDMADGDIFDVITYGRRTMPPYGFANDPQQRWAIISYVRTLQRTFHGTLEDVPAAERSGVEYKPGPPPPPVPDFDFGDDMGLDLGDDQAKGQ